jgi:hypothetical protein
MNYSPPTWVGQLQLDRLRLLQYQKQVAGDKVAGTIT